MTKVADKFITLLSANLRNTQAIKSYALIMPTNYIIRGVHLERTSRKNEYYLWRFVLPLYCPILEILPLSYSVRFRLEDNMEALMNMDGNLAELAAITAMKLQSLTSFTEIAGDFGVEDFLAVCKPSREFAAPAKTLELAITDYLIGEHDRASSSLQELILREKPFFYLEEAKAIARSMLIWLESDQVSLDGYIRTCMSRNRSHHFPGLTMK
jgi:hypothetical protein